MCHPPGFYIHDYSEAVSRMIIEGRSPSLRQVSRTYRVDFGWLYGRINVNNSIPITFVGTTEEVADTFTKGAFAPTAPSTTSKLDHGTKSPENPRTELLVKNIAWKTHCVLRNMKN